MDKKLKCLEIVFYYLQLHLKNFRLEAAFRGKLRQILPSGWRLVRPIFPIHVLALRDYEFDAFRMKFNRSEMDLQQGFY